MVIGIDLDGWRNQCAGNVERSTINDSGGEMLENLDIHGWSGSLLIISSLL
jgi:hypothetical protein